MESDPRLRAEAIFDSFLKRNGTHDRLEFEALLVEFSEHEDALRKLWTTSQRRASDAGSFFGHRQGSTPPREALPALMQPGATVAHFRLLREIGRGGMGQVWEAEDTELRRRIALKVVRPDRIEAKSLALFAREARAGGRLSHPSLVTTLAHGTDSGVAWIAQELIEGSWTLKDTLDDLRAQEEALPVQYYRDVGELIAGVADGMQAAHAAGVIHRDLKPANILIAPDDTPRVTDFGLARVSEDSFQSHTGDFAGTWAYMSPEQVTAKRMGLDQRTDVFSLGVVLYEMLTLKRPFDGDTTHQIATEILYAEPPDPARVRSQCPSELAVICAKALEKVPTSRYGSMTEFAADIRRHLRDEPILAQPPTRVTRARKWVRRHPALSSTFLVAMGALAIVSALLASNMRQSALLNLTNEEKDDALRDLETRTVELAERSFDAERAAYSGYFQAAAGAFTAGSLEGARRLHALCPEPFRGWEWNRLDLALNHPIRRFSGAEGTAWAVSWRPDGAEVAAVFWHTGPVELAGRKSVAIWSRDGEKHQSGHTLEGNFAAVAWSPDSKWFGVADQNQLRIFRANDHELVATVPSAGTSLQWSPDGRHLACFGTTKTNLRQVDPNARLQILAVESWEPVLTTTKACGDDLEDVLWSPDGQYFASATMEPSSGEPVSEISSISSRTRVASIAGSMGCSWSPSGRWLLSRSKQDGLAVIETQTWTVVASKLGSERYWRAAWSPDEELIVATGTDVSLWRWQTPGSAPEVRASHQESISLVAWDPSGERIVTRSSDDIAIVWQLGEGDQLHRLAQITDCIWPAWTPDGPSLALGGRTGLGIAQPENPVDLPLHDDVGNAGSVQWDASADKIAIGTWDQRCILLSAESGEVLHEIAPEHGATTVSFHPDGTRLAVGGHDGLSVWDCRTGARIGAPVLGQPSRQLAWSPDGSRIATAGVDRLHLWEVGASPIRVTSDADGTFGFPICWSPTGDRLAVTESYKDSGWRVVVVIDPNTGKRLLNGPKARVLWELDWSPDGALLAAVCGSNSRDILVWDAVAGAHLTTLQCDTPYVRSIDWQPGGRRLASSAGSGQLTLWDVDRWEPIYKYDAAAELQRKTDHLPLPGQLAWSPDGTRLALVHMQRPRVPGARISGSLTILESGHSTASVARKGR